MMLENFHFIRPYFLFLLLVVIWLMWALYRRSKNNNAWSAVGDADLLSYLLVGRDKKESKFPIVLMFIVGVLLVISISGPAWEKLPQAVYKKEAARVFVLDLSRSMDSTDVLPSRASRAKLKLIDLLKASDEGQVALIVYAAEPHVVSPLTDDAETIVAMIPSLSPSIMPMQGSRTDLAIIKAGALLSQAGKHEGDIILITDGINDIKAQTAAEKLASSGFPVSVMGVGTMQGSPIPMPQGGFLKDSSGAIVIPKLDRSALKTLAMMGSGRYVDLTVDDTDVSMMIQPSINTGVEMSNPLTREVDLWQDEGHWFLLLALPFAALGFRRGWLTVVVFSVSYMPSNDLLAFEWNDLWQTKDQQASELFSAGETEKAAELYQNKNWKGVAHYNNGQYEQAVEAFSQDASIEAMYNRANALAKQGKLEEAIAAYDEVLKNKPNHEDAKFNRDLVKEVQKNQKQKPAGDKSQQGEDKKGQEGSEGQSKEQSEQKNSDQQNSEDSQSQQSNSNSSDSQESTKLSEDKPSEEQKGEEESSEQQAAQQQNENENMSDEEENQKAENAEKQAEQKEGEENEASPQMNQQEESQEQKEIRQATQQWLRRIPDDPGGLLREKFSRQHQRQRQNQQTENPW